MVKKKRNQSEAYYDHYSDPKKPKETADAKELSKFYNKNTTIPIDVSKFDK
ncbi:hypothetical protein [Aquibacillus saliphilus]|uniref:hypothetical protein n=1 Tax=Aquibacillus saliphilus TaxID=1909422 RepID=UPI001CEFB880|nr:hypothetical protein [Aquibacillus saliphilus]